MPINHVFGIGGEQELPRTAPLGHIVRKINDYDAGKTRHGRQNIRKRPDYPRFLHFDTQPNAGRHPAPFQDICGA
jgi:hypothetical protein